MPSADGFPTPFRQKKLQVIEAWIRGETFFSPDIRTSDGNLYCISQKTDSEYLFGTRNNKGDLILLDLEFFDGGLTRLAGYIRTVQMLVECRRVQPCRKALKGRVYPSFPTSRRDLKHNTELYEEADYPKGV